MVTIIETFVGCGGSHFGFKKAGFNTLIVNDIWSDAIQTLKQNDKDLKEEQIIVEDITKLTEDTLKKTKQEYKNVDVLLGGVVCKGFSLAGIRNPYDERNYLYLEQLRLVDIIRPKLSIIENVPGMISMTILKKDEKIKDLCENLTKVCEEHKHKRALLINESKKNSSKEIINEYKKKLQDITHKRKELEDILKEYRYNVIDDIEKEYNDLGYKVYKKVLKCSEYNCSTNRQRLFIVAVRNDIKKEWKYPEPVTKEKPPTVLDAFSLLDLAGINNPSVDSDNIPMNHKKTTIEKFKKIETGKKSEDGFYSRGTSSRLDYNKPAPTLVPGHSSFQIHPEFHRSITVREGGLITGFPNDFKFYGSHTSRCMQIGNSIPVNMAYHLALQCKEFLET